MEHEQWRKYQCQALGITDEQLDHLLEIAKAATVASDGAVGYSELVALVMSMSASEILKAGLRLEVRRAAVAAGE